MKGYRTGLLAVLFCTGAVFAENPLTGSPGETSALSTGWSILIGAEGAMAGPGAIPALHHYTHVRADGHAPIGVMAEHAHKAGEFMIGYRYMFMHMDGLRQGDSPVSTSEFFADTAFTVAPQEMDVEMHMLDLMYGLSDEVTLVAMPTWLKKTMLHETSGGVRFRTDVDHLGDTPFGGIVTLHKGRHDRVFLNALVSAPSGSIEERDTIPGLGDAQLPYPMQTGSGTWDLLPGVTYVGQDEQYSWGTQAKGTIRLGRNENDYSLGDRFDATAWSAVSFSRELSASLRIGYSIWGNIDGADSELLVSPAVNPTARTDMQGGQRVDVAVGLNGYFSDGPMGGLRIAGEFGMPAWQKLEGFQLETDWFVTVGAQWSH